MYQALDTPLSPTVNESVSARIDRANHLIDDPPFYLRRQPCSDIDSTCAVRSDQPSSSRFNNFRDTHTTRSGMGSSGSTSEEFRSVIDDLTIANKKLRQRLKKLENLHCSHLQGEKLFEVRIYGLPAPRKREFEETLRVFATSLEKSPDKPIPIANPPLTSLLPDPLVSLHKPASSSTSCSKPVDSTYASLSASGQTLNSHSNGADHRAAERHAQSADIKSQHVRSYLKNMSQSVAPKRSAIFMSEKAKRKLVVKRLEQIFTGKGAPSSGYGHLLQQQKVSQSAARADRRGNRTGGRFGDVGGVREARMLSANAELPVESPLHPRENSDGDDFRSQEIFPSNGGTPDQRATEPLDLDISRAQIPADNIRYIRHLGVAWPTTNSDTESSSTEGWVYLNLLASMAQLHTFNVTTEFIRKAVTDLSSKFELSSDGTKIRWTGGTEGTQMSSDSDDDIPHGHEISSDADREHRLLGRRSWGRMRMDLSNGSHASGYNSSACLGERAKRRPIPIDQLAGGNVFQYRPLFFHHVRSDDEDDCVQDSDSSGSSSMKISSCTKSKSRNIGAHREKARPNPPCPVSESGPIIFYNNAQFCTDLSGDANSNLNNGTVYDRYLEEPVGWHLDEKSLINGEFVRPLVQDRFDLDDEKESNESDMVRFATSEDANISDVDSSNHRASPVYLEASGLGGVQPQDNFVVDVNVRYDQARASHQLVSHGSPSTRIHRVLSKILESKGASFYQVNTYQKNQISQQAIRTHIVSAVVTSLAPSILPDPSYLCGPFSSDNEDDEDDDTGTSEEDVDKKLPLLSLLDNDVTEEDNQMPIDFAFGSSDGSSQESSYAATSDGSDDSSIDLLAHARAMDPHSVAAQEREFESHAGQTLSELSDGNAGSSR